MKFCKNLGDYGTFDPQQQLITNGSYYKTNPSGVETPYVLQNPAYSLSVKGQLQQHQTMLSSQQSLEKQLKAQQQQVNIIYNNNPTRAKKIGLGSKVGEIWEYAILGVLLVLHPEKIWIFQCECRKTLKRPR